MNIITTLMLGALICARSLSAQIITINNPTDFSDEALMKQLIKIRNSEGSQKDAQKVLSVVGKALKELEEGDLTSSASHEVSVALVEQYQWMKLGEAHIEPLGLLVHDGIIILNKRMTKTIRVEFSYREDLSEHLRGAEKFAQHIMASEIDPEAVKPRFPEYLAADLHRACALSFLVFNTTEPETMLTTKDILLLSRMAGFAEHSKWPEAAKAMQKAAARAASPGKFCYWDGRYKVLYPRP